jgi:hypothetical protein
MFRKNKKEVDYMNDANLNEEEPVKYETPNQNSTKRDLSTDIIGLYNVSLYSGINPTYDTILDINPNVELMYTDFLTQKYRTDKIPGYNTLTDNPDIQNIIEQKLQYNQHYSIDDYSNISKTLSLNNLMDYVIVNEYNMDFPLTSEFITDLYTIPQKGLIFFVDKLFNVSELLTTFENLSGSYSITTSISDSLFIATLYKV